MAEQTEAVGIGEWEIYRMSKAGGLEDALEYPKKLLAGVTDDEEISVDAAFEAKEHFLHQIAGLHKAPDHRSITQVILNQVRDAAETADWEQSGEVKKLMEFIRGFLDPVF